MKRILVLSDSHGNVNNMVTGQSADYVRISSFIWETAGQMQNSCTGNFL